MDMLYCFLMGAQVLGWLEPSMRVIVEEQHSNIRQLNVWGDSLGRNTYFSWSLLFPVSTVFLTLVNCENKLTHKHTRTDINWGWRYVALKHLTLTSYIMEDPTPCHPSESMLPCFIKCTPCFIFPFLVSLESLNYLILPSRICDRETSRFLPW